MTDKLEDHLRCGTVVYVHVSRMTYCKKGTKAKVWHTIRISIKAIADHF